MKTENVRKGVFYLLVTSFLFSSQQALGKVLYYLSTFERTFYFSLVAAIIMGLLCKWKKQPLIAGNLKLIGMRSLFGYISTGLLFLAATQTYPVANISLLSSTSTIFALLAAVIWLKEHMTRGQVLSVFIAFAGILLILRPTGGFIEAESLAGLGAGFFAGLAYTVVRKLKDESPFTITFCFMSFSVIASLPFVLMQGFSPLGLKEIAVLILTGAVCAAAQYFLSVAYSYAPSTKISVYLYSQNLFAFILGILFFHELPDWLSIVGGCLLIGAGILNFISGREAQRRLSHDI